MAASAAPEEPPALPDASAPGADRPRPAPSEAADTPWDPELAEALMRIYEEDAAKWRATIARARTTASAGARNLRARDGDPPLGRKFATAERAGTLIAATIARLEVLEARFAATLAALAQRSDAPNLGAFEAQIADVVARLESLRSELDRLETLGRSVSDLAARLEVADPQRTRAASANALGEASAPVAQLQATAASTAQVASPPWLARLDALEVLLGGYAAERRRGEEALAGALRAIEAALAQIADAGATTPEADLRQRAATPWSKEHAPEDEDHRLLVAAYAEGTRVLGEDALEPALDAADYARGPGFEAETEEQGSAPVGNLGAAARRASRPPPGGFATKVLARLNQLAGLRRSALTRSRAHEGEGAAEPFGVTVRDRRLFAITAAAAALAAHGIWFSPAISRLAL
jgi:hypothetical protein